jgi:Rrf2 family protein
MFAQTSDYALRAAVCLAHAGKPLTTRQIADLTQVPAGYLSKVLQTLAKAGLVRSQRGLYGGFSLRVSPDKLTLLRVINAVDPIHRFEHCPVLPKRLEAGLCNLHHRMDQAMALDKRPPTRRGPMRGPAEFVAMTPKPSKPKRPSRGTAPAARHPALQSFSRAHADGLVHAQRLKRAAAGSPAARRAALAALIDAWDSHFAAHVEEEDRILLSVLSGDQRHHLAAQHREMRALIAEGRRRRELDDPDAAWLADLAQKLDDHIRWEERQLFTALEREADAQTLDAIGQAVREAKTK